MDCVIFTSGATGGALMDAVTDILGTPGPCTVISNNDDDCLRMQRELEAAAGAAGAGGLVVFTDVRGGSCWNVAADSARRLGGMTLVAGVNLPMLLKFFTWRGREDGMALVRRAVDAGAAGIARFRTEDDDENGA